MSDKQEDPDTQAYRKEYSESAFWDKMRKYAKDAGETVLEPALKM